jgi:hypothetical protein
MLVEECEGLGPAVGGLLGPVRHPRRIEERVASAIVAVEILVLAKLLQRRLETVDLILVGVFVVIAEDAE